MVGGVADRIKRRVRIQKLLELGYSIGAICDEEQCSRMTVLRWKKRLQEGEGEQDRPRRGRPRKLTPALKRQVIDRAEGKRHVSNRNTAAWLQRKGMSVSRETVRRTLKEDGLYPFHRRRQQRLTQKQKRRRVAFARQYMDLDWERTLMTDETEFLLVPRGNSKNDVVWVRNVEDVPPIEQDAHSASVRVWAGVSALGRTSLHFYDGNLNGERYRELLVEALPEMQQIFGDADWTFQHDGATSHSDKKTNEWLASNVPHYIPSGPKGEWPAKSPDLNWIENMWSIVAWRVSEGKVPGTLSTLKQKLKRVWSQIPDETLQQCASGMPERLREVIKKKGCALPK